MIRTMMALAVGGVSLGEVNPSRLLDCIRQVEGHKWTDPGGAYCIQPTTWQQHTRLPFAYASTKAHADHVAELHLTWLARELRGADYPVNAYTLATCWRFGLEGFKRRRAVSDYATRVSNLYHEK